MKHLLIILLGFPLSLLSAAEWEVVTNIEEPTLLSVRPGGDQWTAAKGDIQRLHLADSAGHTIETHRGRERTPIGEETNRVRRTSGKITSLQPVSDNRLELICEVPESLQQVSGVELDIPMTDFEREIQIWGLEENGTAVPVVENGILIDYSRYANIRNTTIQWKATGYMQYRILLSGAEEKQAISTRTHMVRIEDGEESAAETWSTSLNRPLKIQGIT